MPLLQHHPDRYLRTPRLERAADGRTLLHVVAWEPEGERVLAFALDEAGQPSAEPCAEVETGAIIALEPGVPPRPAQLVEAEQRTVCGPWSAGIEREGGVSRVWVTRRDGEATVVWEASGIAAAPALAASGQGVWVAFHHDVREDEPRADVAKWIALRFVDADGRVYEPACEMTDRDRDRAGVEQSFEFPILAVGGDGAVALFGRGSHNFWRQDLSADGFTARQPLGDGAWGCRGRWVSVVTMPGGDLLVARREREGIAIERQPRPSGGAPPVRPAAWRIESSGPRIEPVDRARDPAGDDGRQTLFGDIHQHSAHSDGIGTADEAYLRARWGYGDDFCALTDHESFLGKRIGPGEWAHLQAVADRHDAPGRFATLIAYEWTGRRHPGPGHKVVYLPESGLPLISRDDVPNGRQLIAEVQRLGGFAVPHHVGWTGADAPAHDPRGQPVWEICSCHGCYEHADHPLGQRVEHRDQLVQQVMKAGLRFGFIACSDSHGLLWHHGVARKRDPFRTGLTAVQANECTRDEIMSALRQRRCYATSGAKILLELRGGGRPMGSEIAVDGPVPVQARAIGTDDVDTLELVGSEGVLARANGVGRIATLRAERRDTSIYARVLQKDGEMAWSSPIFMNW